MLNKESNLTNQEGLLTLLFKGLVTFCFIFNLSFTKLPFLSSGRIALIVLIFFYGKDAVSFFFSKVELYSFFFIFLYVLILFALVWSFCNHFEDNVILARFFWFTTYSFLGSFLYISMARYQLHSAMLYYFLATLAQSFFVFLTVQNKAFHSWVISNLVVAGNIDYRVEFIRFSGLSHGGADASLIIGIGVTAALILFSNSSNFLNRLFFLLGGFVITLSTIFVGRTGLVISLCALLGFLLKSGRSFYIAILLILIVYFGMDLMAYLSSSAFYIEGNRDVNLDQTFSWAFNLFLSGDSGLTNELISQLENLPDFSLTDYLIGTGRVVSQYGNYSGNYSGHDSGYIQMLYAIGLPLTIFFYLGLLCFCFNYAKFIHKKWKTIAYVMIIYMFILELKEPFIFKYILPFFIFNYLHLVPRKFIMTHESEQNTLGKVTRIN